MPADVITRQAEQQLARFPHTIPVIIQPDTDSPTAAIKAMAVQKYAPPKTWTLAQFVQRVREKIKLQKKFAMFLFVGTDHRLPCVSSTLDEIYEQHKDPETKILWFTMALESTFG